MRPHLLHAMAATTGLCLALPEAVQASSYTTYFGEDQGAGETTPMTTSPNAVLAQDQFLAALIGEQIENFESFATSTAAPLAVSFGSAGTATLQGTGEVGSVTFGTTNGFGRYAVSGTNYWEATNAFSIEFSQPVAAFGFYGVDIGDFNGQVTLELELVGGGTETLIVPTRSSAPGGSVLYFGLLTTDPNLLFTSISFGNTASGTDFFAFDDFTIASLGQVVSAVPLPPALLGGLAGLGAIMLGRRRITARAR